MFFLRVSSQVVEEEKDITDWKCIFHGDNLEDVEGFFLISIEKDDSEFNKFKHVEILDQDCNQKVYYFYHDWLPKNAWFRLRPVHEQLVPYVTPKHIDKKEFDIQAYIAQCG
jgi:hypothetical protein